VKRIAITTLGRNNSFIPNRRQFDCTSAFQAAPAQQQTREERERTKMSKTTRMTQYGPLAALFAGALLLAASPASAAGGTFAQYNQVDGTIQQWTISVVTTATVACPMPPCTVVTAKGLVNFTFSGVPGAPSGPQVANFLLSAISTTGGTTNGLAYSEAGFSGTFSFTDTSLPAGQQNLLSGTFQIEQTGAQLNESIGGTGGGFGASDTPTDPNELVMTSSYIDFTGQTDQTATFTLSSLIPSFSAGGTPDLPTGGPYFAAGAGTFSSNPAAIPSTTDSACQVRYASNLTIADAVISMTNTGAAGAGAALDPTTTGTSASITGAICVNVYTLDPGEELESCCSCPVTPDGLVSLDVKTGLLSNPLFPGPIPNSVVIKLCATVPIAGTGCTGSAASSLAVAAPGLAAWGTSTHVIPGNNPSAVATETAFTPVTMNASEILKLQQLCSIAVNGASSGAGICPGCSPR
jgi:hypothetical protein